MVTAIHGLGAVGKSTLATALAYDEEVQSRFADGILWVTLGQEPNILPMLSGWVQALGDYNFKPTSLDATANHLRTLLYDKAVLLVVDDAWKTDHAKIFNLGGPRCQVLVTTREKAIADVLGSETYSLDVMTLSQSMQLLSQKLGREIRGEEAKQAEALVKELGYLPLALELAAAQVADGMSWGVLLADIQQEIARLKTLDRPSARDVTDEADLKRLSLTASLNLSVKRLEQETREGFIWLGILPDDVNITQGMTAVLWDMDDERDARDELAYLRSKALLLDGVALPDGKSTYRLHDLFHDLARNLLIGPPKPKRRSDMSGLGIGLAEAHGIFLEKYRRLTDNHLWHTLPNDGYIHQHLVWHFEKAGKIEEIHGLLAEEWKSGGNGWYETCDSLGRTGIFINDVARAWELAEIDWDEGKLPQVVAWQCRYALITASINSLAANLPIDLLVALVKHDFWTPEQGLAYALQKPNLEDKVASLSKLADYLPDKLKKLALLEALVATRHIQHEKYRAEVLSALAEKLTPELLPEALSVARQIQDEEYRAQALSALADKFPELLPEALAAARKILYEEDAPLFSALADKFPELLLEAFITALEIQDSYSCTQVLSALADKLTPELLPGAMAAALKIQDSYYKRTRVLSALADKLTPELLPGALAAALQIQNEYDRASFLSALADKLTLEILPGALAAALQIQDEYARAPVLSALADKLTPELLPETLAVARHIQDEHNRAEVLSALANKFPEILPEALAVARQIGYEYNRAQVFSALADKLPELLPYALAAVRQLPYERYSCQAFTALANKLTPQLLPDALAVARQIQGDYSRMEVLYALADKLTPELLPEALAAARQLKTQYNRAEVLSALADKLTPELLPEALAAARQLKTQYNRAEVLSALAKKFSELLPEALTAARQIQDEHNRAEVLSALANKFPEILPEALAAARQIRYESERARVLTALAKKLTPELLPEALAAARQIQYESERARVLSALANKFQLLPEALAAARQIQDEYNCVEAISALAKKLTPELLPEALATARQIQSQEYRAKVLTALADNFPELLPEALAAARQIQSQEHRAEVLSALVEKLSQIPKTQLYPLWQNTLHTLSLSTRRNLLLSDITALTPVIFSLGGEEAIKNTAIAIQDVSRWWR